MPASQKEEHRQRGEESTVNVRDFVWVVVGFECYKWTPGFATAHHFDLPNFLS